jgi:hypothetical protein
MNTDCQDPIVDPNNPGLNQCYIWIENRSEPWKYVFSEIRDVDEAKLGYSIDSSEHVGHIKAFERAYTKDVRAIKVSWANKMETGK